MSTSSRNRAAGGANFDERARTRRASALIVVQILLACLSLVPAGAKAQGRGNGRGGWHKSAQVASGPEITLSVNIRDQIVQFYTTHPVGGAKPLPPGIRRNLARGKPLPPGIAKQTLPVALLERVRVPEGYELVEVGLDVLLVEVATDVIHDVLMDVVR